MCQRDLYASLVQMVRSNLIIPLSVPAGTSDPEVSSPSIDEADFPEEFLSFGVEGLLRLSRMKIGAS